MIIGSIVLLATSSAAIAAPEPPRAADRRDAPVVTTVTPPPPPPPPPFSVKTATVAASIGAQVSDEFKRCGDARTNSNGRYVDAMGTPRDSAEWRIATLAMENALTVCRDLRRALRRQKDFLLEVIQAGTQEDVDAAQVRLDSVSWELEGLEKFFRTETPRYREQLTVGWGNPHCIERALTGFEPPASLCPSTSGAPH